MKPLTRDEVQKLGSIGKDFDEMTRGDLVALSLFVAATGKAKSVEAMREIFDRVDGRVPQRQIVEASVCKAYVIPPEVWAEVIEGTGEGIPEDIPDAILQDRVGSTAGPGAPETTPIPPQTESGAPCAQGGAPAGPSAGPQA